MLFDIENIYFELRSQMLFLKKIVRSVVLFVEGRMNIWSEFVPTLVMHEPCIPGNI